MIGRIEVNGRTVVTMEDDGSFVAASPVYKGVAAHLNLVAAVRQVGDTHRPLGHAALGRAAGMVRDGVAVFAEPAKPLPAGVLA